MGFWSKLCEVAGRRPAAEGVTDAETGGLGEPLGRLLDAVGERPPARPEQTPSDPGETRSPRDTRSIAFTIGAIALGAKMAKADGRVTIEEVATFRRLFQVPESERDRVARVFNLARRDAAGFQPYARQLHRLFAHEPGVLEELLDCLFAIARADGAVTAQELAYLEEVAELFGFSPVCWRRIRAANLPAKQDAYAVLGVDPGVDDGELRRAWLALVQSHHPDRLIAEGLPGVAVSLATEKLAAINHAYETALAERRDDAAAPDPA